MGRPEPGHPARGFARGHEDGIGSCLMNLAASEHRGKVATLELVALSERRTGRARYAHTHSDPTCAATVCAWDCNSEAERVTRSHAGRHALVRAATRETDTRCLLRADPAKAFDQRAEAPDLSDHVLYILIPTAWSAVVVLCVGVCRAAARGDAAPARSERPRPLYQRHRWTYVRSGPTLVGSSSRPGGQAQDRSVLLAVQNSRASVREQNTAFADEVWSCRVAAVRRTNSRARARMSARGLY